MNNFLQIINKNKNNNNFKILYFIFLDFFIFFLIYFYTLEPDIKARDYLPKETSFYYEWTNIKDSIDINLFDNSIPNNKLNTALAMVDSDMNNIESIIWFKIEEEDNYLIKFSKKIDKDFKINNSEYFFRTKQGYILYITSNKELLNILPNYIVEDFLINNQEEGINIYWKSNTPDFLKSLINLIDPVKEREFFINLNSNSINLFYKIESKKENIDLSSAKIITNPDLLTIIKNINKNKNILSNFLISLYNSFPHHSLNLKNLLQDIVLLQKNDNYLLVSTSDWKLVVDKLIQNIKVIEVGNLLPDGTRYTELKQAEEYDFINHNYSEVEYWEIDNLFGLNIDQYYYLSNNKDIIEDIINTNTNIASFSYSCLEENNNINNLLYLNTDKIDNKVIKDYLISKDLKFINLIQYSNHVVEGYKLCF